MYCKKCGIELRDGDRFCSNCGTPAHYEEPENTSEIPEAGARKKLVDTGEFVWDVHDFNKPARKIENVTVDWASGTFTEEGEEAAKVETPAVEVVEAFAEAKATEIEVLREEPAETTAPTEEFAGISVPKIDDTFAWTAPISLAEIENAIAEEKAVMEDADIEAETEGEEVVYNRALPLEGDVAVTIEDIESDIEKINPNLERDTAKIDKFYTLNRKNEEFQKLLDMEYDRIMAGREGTYIMPGSYVKDEPEIEIPAAPVAEEPAEIEAAPEAETPEVFDPVAHLRKAEEERNAALGIGTSVSSMAEYYEKQKQTGVYYDENGQEMRIFDTMELQKDLFEPVLNGKSKNEIINEISDKIASTKEDVERTYSSLLDEIFGQISGASAAHAAAGITNDIPEEASEEIIEEPEVIEVESEVAAEETCGEPVQEETVPEEPQTEETAEEKADDLAFFDEDDDEDEPKRGCLKVVITIIVLLLIFEFAILGIRHFMPDSGAAKFIDDKLGMFVSMFDKDTDTDSGNDDADVDSGNEGDETDLPEIDPRENPEKDLTSVITSAGNINKNVKSITYSADAKYDAEHKYNTTLLASSKPLETNVLYVGDDGVKHYVDEEVVKTIVTYNSEWIDYVNENDKEIFDVLKSGSDAWKNTEGFKANGMKKQFDSLKLGEIRTDGQNSYYIWADEVISTTKSGKTTTGEFSWVYHMELTDGKLLIVDYYK